MMNLLWKTNWKLRPSKKYVTQLYLLQPGVSAIVDLQNIDDFPLPVKVKTMLTNGYNQRLSGDMQIVFRPEYFESMRLGSTHGAWNPYDSHIPLIWFRWK